MEQFSFGQWFYDTLKSDEKYQKHVDKLITPSEEAKKKAERSSTAGFILGEVIGIGWRSVTGTAIRFKDHPIVIMTMIPHKEERKEKVRFFFPTEGAIPEDSGKVQIKPKKKGALRREVVGAKLDYILGCTGKDEIENDKELMNSLFRLFKTQKTHNISDWTDAPITFEITRGENDFFIGKIEACVEREISRETAKLLLDCATGMAERIQSALAARAHVSTQPPQIPLQIFLQEMGKYANASKGATWGVACDQLIREEGREHFRNKYTPEMVRAYDIGILHMVPLPSESCTQKIMRTSQLLGFIDTATIKSKGHLILRGPIAAEPEEPIRVFDFMKKFTLHTELPEPPEGKDYALGDNSITFLVQTRLMNLFFIVLEFQNEDLAKNFLKKMQEVQTKSVKRKAEVLDGVFPGFHKKFEQAVTFVDVKGERALVSRRVEPQVFHDAQKGKIGGWSMDCIAWWQHKNLIFYAYEPDILTFKEYDKEENLKFDEQILSGALLDFKGLQIFQSFLDLLRNYAENKHKLKL